jgi:hypothetical protein
VFLIFRLHIAKLNGKIIEVEVKVKVQFTLEQATKAQSVSRGIAVLFL